MGQSASSPSETLIVRRATRADAFGTPLRRAFDGGGVDRRLPDDLDALVRKLHAIH